MDNLILRVRAESRSQTGNFADLFKNLSMRR